MFSFENQMPAEFNREKISNFCHKKTNKQKNIVIYRDNNNHPTARFFEKQLSTNEGFESVKSFGRMCFY